MEGALEPVGLMNVSRVQSVICGLWKLGRGTAPSRSPMSDGMVFGSIRTLRSARWAGRAACIPRIPAASHRGATCEKHRLSKEEDSPTAEKSGRRRDCAIRAFSNGPEELELDLLDL
jgi:hypothetical protein